MRLFYLFFCLLPFITYSQTESIFLHIDRTICHSGDTIWFRTYILDDSVKVLSTNMYMELYNDSGKLKTRENFPIINGICFGQIPITGKSGFYWLRCYTFNSKGFALQPITISDTGNKTILIKTIKSQRVNNSENLIEIEKDSNDKFLIRIKDTFFTYSLAVVNINEPFRMPVMFDQLPIHKIDSSFLSFEGKMHSLSTKDIPLNNEKLVLILKKDSIISSPQLVPIDSNGLIFLNGLYFYDTAYLQYQINGWTKYDFELYVYPKVYPIFIPPSSKFYDVDTVKNLISSEFTVAEFKNAKQLKDVVVKASWWAKQKALDKKYVLSKWFENGIEAFAFDLCNKDITHNYKTVREFIHGSIPMMMLRTEAPCTEGLQCYLDEQKVSIEWLFSRSLDDFGYLKLFRDGSCKAICIYTKKGKDLEQVSGRMKTIVIKGYDKPLQWSTSDQMTYLWEPYINSNEYKFTSPRKNFKVIIMGNINGSSVFYEKYIEDEKIKN